MVITDILTRKKRFSKKRNKNSNKNPKTTFKILFRSLNLPMAPKPCTSDSFAPSITIPMPVDLCLQKYQKYQVWEARKRAQYQVISGASARIASYMARRNWALPWTSVSRKSFRLLFSRIQRFKLLLMTSSSSV